MNRIIRRAALTVAATGVAVAAVAGTASADDASFIDTLGRMGHPQSQGTRQSAINLGWAICNDLAQNGGDTTATTLHLQRNGWSMQEAADWVVVAENDLCP